VPRILELFSEAAATGARAPGSPMVGAGNSSDHGRERQDPLGRAMKVRIVDFIANRGGGCVSLSSWSGALLRDIQT